jgi:hypothetical protein
VPSIVSDSVIFGSADSGAIVCGPDPMEKLITSGPELPLASTMAWRSEPSPASAVLLTRNVESSARLSNGWTIA